MNEKDITCEEWREYDFSDTSTPIPTNRVYRIDNPKTLIWRDGGSTHRVVDMNGIVHCCPAPGNNGCILRWKSRDEDKPVAF